MQEYSLKLLSDIITVFQQNITIREQLEIVCKKIKEFFNLEGITYFAYFNKLEHIVTLPNNFNFFNIPEKFIIKCEVEKIVNKNLLIINFPVKDSFYIYGVLQIVIKKGYIESFDEKLMLFICNQLTCFIHNHRINEAFQSKLEEINKNDETSQLKIFERERKSFYSKLIKLISKIFITTSKRKILQYFSAFLMYNNYIVIEKGGFFIKENNLYKLYYVFEKDNFDFNDFNDALEKIVNIPLKETLKESYTVKDRKDIFMTFKDSYIFNIGNIGFFVCNKHYPEIKFLLKLLEISFKYSNYFTELKTLKNKLEKVGEGIIKDEGIDKIKELVNQISHEIKNPLVAVSGFAQRILKNVEQNNNCENIKDYAKIIVDESGRLENLLNDLINFNRIENKNIKKVSLYSILKKTINFMKVHLDEKNIELIFEYKKVPKINGDPLQLRQGFFNLLLNAIEAVENNGKIKIRLRSSSKNVIVEIEDNGPGIPDKILHNIFNPFFTTKIKGTGLGLPITYRIVKNHNGEIDVKKLPKGTIFTIKIPIGAKNEEKNLNN